MSMEYDEVHPFRPQSATTGLVQLGKMNETSGTLIFLHGLGDSSTGGWLTTFHKFRRLHPHVRVVLPNASKQPVTLNQGKIMTAWHDIEALETIDEGAFEGLEISKEKIWQLIQNEENLGRPTEKIILAGFSQGGALSLYAGLQYHKKLGAIGALSSYLPHYQKFSQLISAANQETPILMAHGDTDNVVKYEFGRKAVEILQNLKFSVNFQTYKHLRHTTCEKEIKLFYSFILQNLGPSPTLTKAKEEQESLTPRNMT